MWLSNSIEQNQLNNTPPPLVSHDANIAAYRQSLLEAGELIHLSEDRVSHNGFPLVSVITPMLNSAAHIKECLASIQQQTYPNIEHIVVDGFSSDGCFELVLEHKSRLDVIIRGKDKSAAEACNKGVAFCRGEFICTLPSDDMYDLDYVACAVDTMQKSGGNFVYGDLILMGAGRKSLLVPGAKDYDKLIHTAMPNINSVSILYRRESFGNIGLWNISDRYACDYDWLLRAHIAGLKGHYDPAIRVWYRDGGISSKNYSKALAETRNIALRHGGPRWRIHLTYTKGVFSKLIRDLMQKVLPDSVFYKILYHFTRANIQPINEDLILRYEKLLNRLTLNNNS